MQNKAKQDWFRKANFSVRKTGKMTSMLKVAKRSVNAMAAWCIKRPTKMMNLSAEKIVEEKTPLRKREMWSIILKDNGNFPHTLSSLYMYLQSIGHSNLMQKEIAGDQIIKLVVFKLLFIFQFNYLLQTTIFQLKKYFFME